MTLTSVSQTTSPEIAFPSATNSPMLLTVMLPGSMATTPPKGPCVSLHVLQSPGSLDKTSPISVLWNAQTGSMVTRLAIALAFLSALTSEASLGSASSPKGFVC